MNEDERKVATWREAKDHVAALRDRLKETERNATLLRNQITGAAKAEADAWAALLELRKDATG